MLRSILVANRGEIACRIMRTARALGVQTIAVYSGADRHSAHVRAADVAEYIGPAAAKDSYLDAGRIMAAARRARAEALHPGYGFLSESEALVSACTGAGIVFVGPPIAAMAAVGSKRAAKVAARRIGVPVLPGYDGPRQSLAELETEALQLGLPLMVKPSGGGGGKGMQVVTDAAQLSVALASARRLATSAFDDPTLLLERWLPAPRHVEVQIIADHHGQVVALFDRDCSVQRRHQKLIEEAPAPNLDAALRQRMQAAAVAIAREVGYINAGTVEFLVQGGEFWFMEMNARLQVEHPVTELVTGIDLVEWQLRVAAGERLPQQQHELQCQGHAVEARVCAEDPQQDFTPSAGALQRCDWPLGLPGVRVDAGIATGDRVSSHYDSLLGKVIAHDMTRAAAIERLQQALSSTRIGGVASNVHWLRQVLATETFRAAAVTTDFLAGQGERLTQWQEPSAVMKVLAALAVLHEGAFATSRLLESPWAMRDAFRPGMPAQQAVLLEFAARKVTVLLACDREWHGTVEDECCTLTWQQTAERDASVRVSGQQRTFRWSRNGELLQCWLDDEAYRCCHRDGRQHRQRLTAHDGALTAALPGTVVMVAVKAGDQVAAGQVLLVLEAMKMEHTIRAPRAATVAQLHFGAGSQVQAGAVLIELD